MHTPNQKTGIYMANPAGAHWSVYAGENSSASGDGPGRAAPPGKPTPPGAQQDINTTASSHMATEMNHVFFIGGSPTTVIEAGPVPSPRSSGAPADGTSRRLPPSATLRASFDSATTGRTTRRVIEK